MRITIYLILFSLLSCARNQYEHGHSLNESTNRIPSQTSGQESSQAREVHLILDIDWTIVRPLEYENLEDFKNTGRVISLTKEDHYLLTEGTREILDFAEENPWLKITFFSGGPRERNFKLLDKIESSQGRTARQMAHKILSNEELTIVSQDESLRFSHRHKKDLTKAHSNLEDVIFVDDLKHFALDNGGLERTAWLGRTFHPWPQGMDHEQYRSYWLGLGKKEEHLAPSPEVDYWTKRKLFVLLAAIEEEGPDPEAIHKRIMDIDLANDRFYTPTLEVLQRSPSYQKFISTLGCPVPIL